MTKFKKIGISVAAMAMTVAVTAGATMAYLTATTNKATNTFTGSHGITGTLKEPSWTYGTTGVTYTPGQTIAKDPLIEINAKSPSAYVAMKVKYYVDNEQVDAATFAAKATIKSIDANNEVKDGIDSVTWGEATVDSNKMTEIYFYQSAVIASDSAAATTDPLFDKVFIVDTDTVKDDPTTTTVDEGADATLSNLRIELQGYAIQTADFANLDAAKPQLKKLASFE